MTFKVCTKFTKFTDRSLHVSYFVITSSTTPGRKLYAKSQFQSPIRKSLTSVILVCIARSQAWRSRVMTYRHACLSRASSFLGISLAGKRRSKSESLHDDTKEPHNAIVTSIAEKQRHRDRGPPRERERYRAFPERLWGNVTQFALRISRFSSYRRQTNIAFQR